MGEERNYIDPKEKIKALLHQVKQISVKETEMEMEIERKEFENEKKQIPDQKIPTKQEKKEQQQQQQQQVPKPKQKHLAPVKAPYQFEWEKHTKGIGLKLMKKMNFTGRLGRNEDGVTQTFEVTTRPDKAGLGTVREATESKRNLILQAEYTGEKLRDILQERARVLSGDMGDKSKDRKGKQKQQQQQQQQQRREGRKGKGHDQKHREKNIAESLIQNYEWKKNKKKERKEEDRRRIQYIFEDDLQQQQQQRQQKQQQEEEREEKIIDFRGPVVKMRHLGDSLYEEEEEEEEEERQQPQEEKEEEEEEKKKKKYEVGKEILYNSSKLLSIYEKNLQQSRKAITREENHLQKIAKRIKNLEEAISVNEERRKRKEIIEKIMKKLHDTIEESYSDDK